MVCQKMSYFDALSLDISGGGEAVSSDLCDSSNVTVLEFLSGPIPTSSTVVSPKAISCVVLPLNLHYLFYLFGPHLYLKFFFSHSTHWVPKKFGKLGKKNFVFLTQIHPLMVSVLLCLPFSSWVVQILSRLNTYQNSWHIP